MSTKVADLVARIRALESELEEELKQDLQQAADVFRYRIERGRVRFEAETSALHLKARQSVARFLLNSSLRTVLSAPIIYFMLVPLVLLDLTTIMFQATCFRIYGIARVDRSRYVAIDRHRLDYLNWIEKLNCDYCSYANGVLAFAREVAARTEQYWCPIKHARRVLGPHSRYAEFVAYGDAEAWSRDVPGLREAVRARKG